MPRTPPDVVMAYAPARCVILFPHLGEDAVDNHITPVDKFDLPIGRQTIELQRIVYESGGMPQLRLRIREGKRFTVIDIDPDSAERWGHAMIAWAAAEKA